MENRNKQRVVGFVAIVIACVVFVFFLLRNPAQTKAPPVMNNSPIPTEQKISELSFELAKPAVAKVAASTIVAPAIPVSAPPTPAAPAPPVTLKPQPVIAPAATQALPAAPIFSEPRTPPVLVHAPQKPAIKITRVIHREAPELRALQMMLPPQAWVVQVGVFSSPWRANQLVARLRANGFDVYMRPVSRSTHRVSIFVGPKIRHSDIERIRNRLKDDFHLHGIIRKYQP